MKKNLLIVGAVMALTGVTLLGKTFAFKSNLTQYIESNGDSGDLQHIVKAMQIAQITDVPGLAGWVGDHDEVEHLLQTALTDEANAYRPIGSAWFTPPIYSTLAKCASQMHTTKLSALASLKQATASRWIRHSLNDEILKNAFAYIDQSGICQVLLRMAELKQTTSADQSKASRPTPERALPVESKPVAEKNEKGPQSSLKERFRPIDESLPSSGDPDGEAHAIDVLSHPETLDDWRFLAALDKQWASMDCGDAAFCYARKDLITRAERKLKETGLAPPPEANMKFLLLETYKTTE